MGVVNPRDGLVGRYRCNVASAHRQLQRCVMTASQKLVPRPLSLRWIIVVPIYHTPRVLRKYVSSNSFELSAIIRICETKGNLLSRTPPFVYSCTSPPNLLILPLLCVLAKSTETEKHRFSVRVARYAISVSLILVIRHVGLKSILD